MGVVLGIIIFLLMAGFVTLAIFTAINYNNKIYDVAEKANDLQRVYDRNNFRTEEEKNSHLLKIDELKNNGEKLIKAKVTKLILFISLSVISLIMFIFIPFSIHKVNTGEIAVVKVWGKTEYTKSAGTYFDFWVGKEYIKYDTKVREIDSQTMAYSQDAQTMDITLTIQYRIYADKVMNINEEFGPLDMLESRIKSVGDEKTKTVMSSMQAMNIIETRDTLSGKVITVLDEATEKYYVEIVNVLITNIDFSDAFEQAVENKMIAEQQQLQEEYNKHKQITQAEAQLEVAKKEAEALLERAKADAEATKVKAEAEARALEILQETWDAIPTEVRAVMLQEMAIENWDGKTPSTMVGTDFLEWLMGKIGG